MAAPARAVAAVDGPAARLVRALAAAAGLAAREDEILACLSLLTGSWADLPPEPPPWSGLGADASGCDASLVLDGARREIRLTAEARGRPACPETYRRAALASSRRLEALHGADLAGQDAVADLFAAPDPGAAGVLWHGAVFREDAPPWFKLYWHLMARGRDAADVLARAALARLGRAAAWADLAARRGPGDAWLFLSHDLLPAPRARVKLYLRHGQTSAAALDRIAAGIAPEGAGAVAAFVDALTGAGRAPISRGALTTFQVEPGADAPSRVTTHLRLYPHCAESDALLAGRLARALARLGIPAGPYEAALGALCPHGLAGEKGLHGWASLQWIEGRPSVAVYFCPRLNLARHGPIALDPERFWPSPVAPIPAEAIRCAPR